MERMKVAAWVTGTLVVVGGATYVLVPVDPTVPTPEPTVEPSQDPLPSDPPPSTPTPVPTSPTRRPILREGGGANSKGGEGCPKGKCGDVYHVTTLADSGPGSLRDGIVSRAAPRNVVFDVAGVIVLKSEIQARLPYLTVDGSSAPAPGITIDHSSFVWRGYSTLGTHNVIWHDVRFLGPMDPAKPNFTNAHTALNDGDTVVNPVPWDDRPEVTWNEDILFSHVTFIRIQDDAGSMFNGCRRCSMAGSFFLEDYHPFVSGAQSGWVSATDKNSRHDISFVQNVCVAIGERCPQIREGTYGWDVVGNIVHDWRDYSALAGKGPGGNGFVLRSDSNPNGNIVGNAFLPGVLRPGYGCLWGTGPGGDTAASIRSRPLYYAANLFPLDAQGRKLNAAECVSNAAAGQSVPSAPLSRAYPLTMIQPEQLEAVLAAAGMSWPTPAEQAEKERTRIALLARLAKGRGPQ